MFHAVTIPRAGFLHTTVYTNTSFRGTEGDGGSTTRYEALRRGCERSKVSMKCKGSKALSEDDLKLSVGDRLQMIEDDLKLMADDSWMEDHLKTVERMNRTASDVEQTNNVMERHSVVEGSASILDERARNRYERARMLTEQAKKLNSALSCCESSRNLLCDFALADTEIILWTFAWGYS